MRAASFLGLLICACLIGVPGVVRAQEGDEGEDTPASRPFRGLFGLADNGRTGLSAAGSLFGAYDDNLTASLIGGATPDPRYQRSGGYGGATGQLNYTWRGERSAFSAFASSAGNYYPDHDRPWVTSYSAGIGFSRPIGRRNSFSASQAVAYSPYFLFSLFPEEAGLDAPPVSPIEVTPDFSVSELTTLRYSSSLNLSRSLTRRSSVNAFYSFGGTTFDSVRDGHAMHRAGFGYRRRITGALGLRLGYAYRTAQYALFAEDGLERPRSRSHDVDAGVDYAKALSVSRRTRISFGTGSNILVREAASGGEAAPTGTITRFHAAGYFTLTREIGRTWGFSLNYDRSAAFSDVLLDPVLSDSVTASLGGLVGRRNEIRFAASLSAGEVGFGDTDNGYSTYTASAQWRRALTRNVAAFARYLYYHYNFGGAVQLPTGFVRELDRQGVRVGIQAWVPLLRR